MSNDRIRFELPELYYQTVEVDFDGTIAEALDAAFSEVEGDEIGKPVYEHMLEADDFMVRMVDNDGNVLAYYRQDVNHKWRKV